MDLNMTVWRKEKNRFIQIRLIYRWENNSHDIKALMKVIKTETFNVGFTSQ